MSHRVLIAEDEIIVADDLEWQLSKMGYEVVGIASSGEEAITLAQRERAAIVLMDIQLQGRMSGIDAAKAIQRLTGAAIIYVTAFPAIFLRNTDGMNPPGLCIGKPYSKVQLRTALDAVTEEWGSAS
jgi:DNA-binding NarL/FixJ family response regulator